MKRKDVIVAATNIIKYLALRKQGYTTIWTGEGKICLRPPAKKPKASVKIHVI